MSLLLFLLDLYTWVIIARALVSWVSLDPRNPIVQFLYQATEPVLRPLRQIVSPDAIGGIDISPILTIVLIQIVKYLLVSLAYS